MSRCFAFNPQAYAKNLAFKEAALNEPFKLQKECKNTEASRKTEKKRKRGREKIMDVKKESCSKKFPYGGRVGDHISISHSEKSKDSSKEQKSGVTEEWGSPVSKDAGNVKKKGSYSKKFPYGGRVGDHISISHSKKNEDSSEEQRSGVTEEWGSPLCSQSSDVMSGRQRKSDDASRSSGETPSVPGIERCGRILRIKLPVKKQNLDETLKCSDILSQPPRDVGVQQQQPIASTSKPFVPEKIETSVKCSEVPSSSKPSSSAVPLQEGSAEFLYKTLVEDWTPPAIVFEASDDESWLFERKEKGCAEIYTAQNDIHLSNTSLWPKASYLKNAEIYALPYTVPF